MAVFTLEDHQGAVEVVAFPETYGRFRHLIDIGALLLVRGKFERDDDSSRFQAAELSPLEALRERLAKAVSIHLPAQAMSRATLEALWDVLAPAPGRSADRARSGGRAGVAPAAGARRCHDRRSACGRPSSWSRRSSGCAAPARSCCNRRPMAGPARVRRTDRHPAEGDRGAVDAAVDRRPAARHQPAAGSDHLDPRRTSTPR